MSYKHKIVLQLTIVMDEMDQDDPEGSAEIAEALTAEALSEYWTHDTEIAIVSCEAVA